MTRRRFSPFTLIAQAARDFVGDDVLTLAAALTFATLLSFAPLLILALRLTTALGFAAQDAIADQVGAIAGPGARDAAVAVLDSAGSNSGTFADLIGAVLALIGATTVLAQLQTSLNDIWHVPPRKANALGGWLRHRVLTIGLLPALAFVAASSLLISASLGNVLDKTGALWELLNQLVSLLVFGALFALLFRYLADARLAWRHAFGGGAATSVLFTIGKALIGLYLAHGSIGNAYGAAGSLVLLLVWVYYSSAIFFFGAELVKAWCLQHGRAPGEAIAQGPKPPGTKPAHPPRGATHAAGAR